MYLNIDIGRFFFFKPPLYGKTKGLIGSKKSKQNMPAEMLFPWDTVKQNISVMS